MRTLTAPNAQIRRAGAADDNFVLPPAARSRGATRLRCRRQILDPRQMAIVVLATKKP